MRPKENLHYAIGQLAYAVARADGEVQKEERQRFADIITTELAGDEDFNISGIIFQVLDKEESISTEDAYDWAMNQIRINSHYLSPELKQKFIMIMEKVAKAYPPVTVREMLLLDRFRKDIAPIHADPVYYRPGH